MRLFSRQLSDQELVEGIRNEGPRRRYFENKLYDQFAYLIRDGVRKNRLSEEDAASAYSDAIFTVIEHISNGRFEGLAKLKTYLTRIFTNKCVDFIRKNTTNRSSVNQAVSLDDLAVQIPDSVKSVVQGLISQQEHDLLRARLQTLTGKCREMLLTWAEGFSDAEIAETLGYHSAAVAKTSRLRCLEQLRELYRTSKS
ncbi:RNA polymerase sigma factor [Tellurirhabdus rosea]|uniref:RNA polymerase sigma factor n=1 Tax=Tellurirhabdus rosea TaxID=2674997 RepID=UPI0022501F0A|nr:sigma-70 family RNA polymerase sigma factor [Tellurirhabdus rosea]